MTRSYSLSSSVLFGALTPNAPAIILPATDVVFSGRLSGPPLLELLLPLSLKLEFKLYGTLSGYSNCVGLAGVGGGGFGGLSREVVVDKGCRESCGEPFCADLPRSTSSVSVSDPLSSASQLSATGLDLGFCAVFCGCEAESSRLPRVFAISGVTAC